MVYYNEFNPHAAEWLRELMRENLIAKGDVDERSITDVSHADLRGYVQCHFFAGIGGWSTALRAAGWSDDRPVWSGSCPCQPYSAAGKQKGNEDARNLWPAFARLIRECRPDAVFGEQVEGAIRHGWLDGVCADLEGEGYTVGACVLGAHSVGAPHIRQRLYWVADSGSIGRIGGKGQRGDWRQAAERREAIDNAGDSRSAVVGVADADGGLSGNGGVQPGWEHGQQPQDGGVGGGLEYATSDRRGERGAESERGSVVGRRSVDGMGNADSQRESAVGGIPEGPAVERIGSLGGLGNAKRNGREARERDERSPSESIERPTEHFELRCGLGHWSDSFAIRCSDGKARRIPIEPGLFPLAHGVSNRVELLRGAGNAICTGTAQAFIRAFIETKT